MALFDEFFARKPARPPFRPHLESLETRWCPTGDLAAPNNLHLTPASSTQLTLKWDDTAGEAGYHVLHWTGTQVQQIASLKADVTTYTVKGLTPGQKEWYSIEAFNDVASAKTLWMSVTMPVDPISAVTNLKTKALSPTEIKLTWTDAQGETGYNIYQWNGKKAVKIASLKAGTTTYTVTGLAANTTYFFYVESYNVSGNAITDWQGGKTLVQPVTQPGNLIANPASSTKVILTWSDSQGETGYHIYQWDGSKAVLIGKTKAGVTTFTVNGLKGGTAYWFYVEAYNPSNTANTDWKLAITPTNTHLKGPATVTAKAAGSTSVKLTWTASAGAVGYRVYHWNGTTWESLATLNSSIHTYTAVGLTAKKTNYFIIQAFTANNIEAANSKVVSVAL